MNPHENRPQIPSQEMGYIDEHLSKLEKHVKRMREALTQKDSKNFVDNFSAMQWEERSILTACKKLMSAGKFTESDLGMRKLDVYINTEE